MEEHDFGWALRVIKYDRSDPGVSRAGWNGKGLVVRLQREGGFGPFMYLEHGNGTRVPWTPSQTDSLADDWMEGAN